MVYMTKTRCSMTQTQRQACQKVISDSPTAYQDTQFLPIVKVT